MTPIPHQLDNALTDVRRAFRLLHDYQRLAMDAAAYIGRQLGLPYAGGWHKYGKATPRDGGGNLSLSAWDWLPMMLHEFYFQQPLPDGGKLLFSILLISDTGFFMGDQGSEGKGAVSKYAPVDQSQTCIAFLASTNVKAWQSPGFVWDREQMRVFIETGGNLPEDYAANGIFGKCCDFKRIATEEDTNRLIDELVAEMGRKGIPLKRLERKV